MTSNRGAGYTPQAAQQAQNAGTFDPFGGVGQPQKSALQKKAEASPEEQLREMEKEIHRLIEESALVHENGDLSGALEKAKEAAKKERLVCRQREQQGLADQMNADLTYAACLNLAIQHQHNGNDQEAMAIYNQLVKNKQYQYAGRFRVNMGNIYYAQKKYPTAIKMFRMALDQIPAHVQGARYKIFRNIGHAFFQMRQFVDAVEAYENVLVNDGSNLDYITGFNLILCYYALGDHEKMKQGFERLISIQQVGMEDEEEEIDALGGIDSPKAGGGGLDEVAKDVLSHDGPDALREDIKRRQREAVRYILHAAQLIGPVIEKDASQGYEWLSRTLVRHCLPGLSAEIDIIYASYHMKRKDFDQAIETLKRFEKRETSLMARAATNLSFLYFLEGDFAQAENYADMAVKADRYNSRALVNKGNCLFVQQEFERAKEVYLESIGVSADCLEAIYNLGIVNVQIGRYQEAMLAFDKLHSITHHNCEVLWQLGNLCEQLGDLAKAQEWFSLVVTAPRGRPTDPGVLARIAQIFSKQDDEVQAYHYQLESYRYWPVDINVITWLGIYYVKQELYEQAIPYFARAAEVETNEAKWKLMVASCHRRLGSFQTALTLYENIHKAHPMDQECLRYLVQICEDLNLPMEKYKTALRKLERMAEAQEEAQRQQMSGDYGMMMMDDRMGGMPDAMSGLPGLSMPGPQSREHDGPEIEELPGSDSVVADDIPMQKKAKKKLVAKPKQVDDDDLDWGDNDIELP
jgi:intraflagellar transport protein 88